MAVGARTADIVRLVVRDGAGLALAGVIAGTIIGLVAAGWIETLLFDVSPRDPLVFGGVAVTLVVIAVLAAAIPSLRATRVDPVVALRAE